MMISFAARALSSIPGGTFCYNAVASASIVSILPGFLICKLFDNITIVDADNWTSEWLA
jgi:uncharacterized membrane protein YjjP (DUF1212 family)